MLLTMESAEANFEDGGGEGTSAWLVRTEWM